MADKADEPLAGKQTDPKKSTSYEKDCSMSFMLLPIRLLFRNIYCIYIYIYIIYTYTEIVFSECHVIEFELAKK